MLIQMFKKNTAKTIHLLLQWAERALPCSIWLQSHSGKGSDFCCPASNNVSFSKKKKKITIQQATISKKKFIKLLSLAHQLQLHTIFKYSLSYTDRCKNEMKICWLCFAALFQFLWEILVWRIRWCSAPPSSKPQCLFEVWCLCLQYSYRDL